MTILFTQYMLPRGKKVDQQIERPEEIQKLADKFVASGGVYEMEILRTGDFSFTAQFDEEDIAIELLWKRCYIELDPNSVEMRRLVEASVDKLVKESVNWLDNHNERAYARHQERLMEGSGPTLQEQQAAAQKLK